MSDKPRRRWFQFHLSTAMMVMIVAGLLAGANVRMETFSLGNEEVYTRGWPYTFVGNISADVIQDFFLWNNLAWNVAVALVILAALATFCELIIRRRKHG